jgi:ribonuclease HI
MRFKGEQVWVRADDSGRPVVDGDGRAEMKYRESDAKSYRPSAANLFPDTGEPGPAPNPQPAERKRPRAATGKPKATGKPHAPAPGGGAVEIWTDGACSGNPGPMGIGVVVIDGGQRHEKGEYLGVGTNNIAELTAIERGIELANSGGSDGQPRRLRVYTDSSYAIGVLDKGWKAKANQELIARLKRRLAPLDVEFVKVSGHAGVPENERCDELARGAVTGRSR